MIYLDNAATTLYKPRAVEQAVRRAMYGAAGYARGGYAAASRAGELVYACREQAAALFGVGEPERVIFTLNATHALNIAINALVKPDSRVIVSGYEHNAVMRPLTARNIEPTVLDTPLWDGAAMVSALRQALEHGVLGTMLTRFLPFAVFRSSRSTPWYIQYLGKVLPGAVFAMLVIYCLRNVSLLPFDARRYTKSPYHL